MKRPLLILLISSVNVAFAAFSAFAVITPENEAEHPLMIQAEPVDNQKASSRIRVIGPVDGSRNAWLIVCNKPLMSGGQNFRNYIWNGEQGKSGILHATRLHPDNTTLPESVPDQYKYVEVVLTHDVMRRAYIYIDFPVPVSDGGYHYSIDLAYYIEGDMGKKSLLKWGPE